MKKEFRKLNELFKDLDVRWHSQINLGLIIMVVIFGTISTFFVHAYTEVQKKIAGFQQAYGVAPENKARKQWRRYVQQIVTETLRAKSSQAEKVWEENMNKREELNKRGDCESPAMGLFDYAPLSNILSPSLLPMIGNTIHPYPKIRQSHRSAQGPFGLKHAKSRYPTESLHTF